MSIEDGKDLWVVNDPIELEEVYFEKLEDALAYIRKQCDGGIDAGDSFSLRLAILRKG